jgi:hypothetical protein
MIENWEVDPYISQTLDPTATNFGQFVHHMHPCLPAKFESTPPINDEVIREGVKISRKKVNSHYLEIGKFNFFYFSPILS